MKGKLRKLLVLGFSAAIVAGVLASCGSSSSSSNSSSSDGSSTLTFGCQNYGDGLVDPADQTNAAWNAMRYGITECLFKFNDSMEVESWIASDYTVSDDHKTWTFTIRDDAYFSDGCQVTPSAIKASFERLFEAGADGSSRPGTYLEESAVITADDDNWTLTIETETAYPDLTKNLAYPVMAIVDVNDTEDYDHAVIGSGPYAISAYTTDVGYDLVANEYYYEDVPYDNVTLLYLGDATAKANALTSGQIDLTENISTASDLQSLQEDDSYTVNIATGVRTGFSYINFDGVLSNDSLRQAILMAIDGQTMCDTTVGGLYTYGYSVLPSNLTYNYDELTNPYSFDVEAAEALLDEAGIVDTDGDGIREIDGENITLEWITYENRCLADFAQAGQQSLAEIGIDVNITSTDSDSEWNMMVNGEYDLCSSNWTTVGTGDPTEFLANWYGPYTEDQQGNYCNYQSDEFDALYSQLLTELDDDVRTELITEMQQILIDDAAVLVHGYYNSSMISNSSAISNAPIHTADYYWLTTEITPAE